MGANSYGGLRMGLGLEWVPTFMEGLEWVLGLNG